MTPQPKTDFADLDADTSPDTMRSGTRRVNKVPLMIGGGVLLAFVGVLATVVAGRQAAQNAKPAEESLTQVRTTTALADEVLGDNKTRSGAIEAAKPLDMPNDFTLSSTPVLVARTDAPPLPTTPITAAPEVEDPDVQRIRVSKMALFDQAVRAKTGVNWNAPRTVGQGQTIAATGDAQQKLAAVRAQMASERETDPTQAYQKRLEQIRSAQAGGAGSGSGFVRTTTNSSAGVNASTTATGSIGGGNNAFGGNAANGLAPNGVEYSKWHSDAQPEAPRTPFELRAGYVIPATLISGINSELPGQIIGQVSSGVYDTATGKHLLIPQGSRLVGAYSADVVYGQSRVLIAWQRVIFPDGKALDLGSMPGSDSAGYAGFNDKVNNHYGRIYANALLMSGVIAGVAYSQQQTQTGTNQVPTPEQTLSAAVTQQLGQVTTQMISKNLSIAPTLEIRPGYRFNVVVIKDLSFKKPYASFDYN